MSDIPKDFESDINFVNSSISINRIFPSLLLNVICVFETSVTFPITPLFSTSLSWATREAILFVNAFICCWVKLSVGAGLMAAYELGIEI